MIMFGVRKSIRYAERRRSGDKWDTREEVDHDVEEKYCETDYTERGLSGNDVKIEKGGNRVKRKPEEKLRTVLDLYRAVRKSVIVTSTLVSTLRKLGSWIRILSVHRYVAARLAYVGRGVATGRSFFQGVLANVYRIKSFGVNSLI
jgi:hypothetical protein